MGSAAWLIRALGLHTHDYILYYPRSTCNKMTYYYNPTKGAMRLFRTSIGPQMVAHACQGCYREDTPYPQVVTDEVIQKVCLFVRLSSLTLRPSGVCRNRKMFVLLFFLLVVEEIFMFPQVMMEWSSSQSSSQSVATASWPLLQLWTRTYPD